MHEEALESDENNQLIVNNLVDPNAYSEFMTGKIFVSVLRDFETEYYKNYYERLVKRIWGR